MIYGVKADSVLYETTRLSVYPPHGPEIILPLLSSIGMYFFLFSLYWGICLGLSLLLSFGICSSLLPRRLGYKLIHL